MISNHTSDEGYLKFKCILEQGLIDCNLIPENFFIIRNKMTQLNLIGELDNGIGFGNLSSRLNPQNFLITGTRTGGVKTINCDHIVKINSWDSKKNIVWAQGRTEASSETLTHASIYTAEPEVNGIIHIHSAEIWQHLMNERLPHTSESITYGTVEMADAVTEIVTQIGESSGYFAMGGHADGVIAYGKTLNQAKDLILDLHNFAGK